MLLLAALAAHLRRQVGGQRAGLEPVLPVRPQTAIERILLLELTAGMMALIAILRLIYAAQDDGWTGLAAHRWAQPNQDRIIIISSFNLVYAYPLARPEFHGYLQLA